MIMPGVIDPWDLLIVYLFEFRKGKKQPSKKKD